jgi:O-antigen ligase
MLDIGRHVARRDQLFLLSSFMFRIGLATMTFDQIRPFGVLAADYFFLSSLLLLSLSNDRRLLISRGSGSLLAGGIILCAMILAHVTAAGAQMFVLFGLFAPLAIAHSENIRKNLLFLVGGISVSCSTALVAAWVWPGIANLLTISPLWPTDSFVLGGRFGGLAGHPMILGLSSALAVLVAVGVLSFENRRIIRCIMFLQIPICTLGALLSGSRNFLASLVPSLVLLALWRRWTRKMMYQTCLALAGIVIAWIAISYVATDAATLYVDRLTRTSAEDTENSGRLIMAAVAVAEIAQKPVMGWGMEHFGEAGGVFIPVDGEVMFAHDNFLQYWYAMGLLGAIGFLSLFVLPIRRMLIVLKRHPPEMFARILRLGVCVYVLLFIASNLQPILLNRFLYMPLFLFAGLTAKTPSPRRVNSGRAPSHRLQPSLRTSNPIN